jgi:hypothetical protein
MLVHAVMDLSRRFSTVVPEKDERKKEKQMLMSSELWDKAQKWVAGPHIAVLCKLTPLFFSLLTRLDSHLKGGNGACS